MGREDPWRAEFSVSDHAQVQPLKEFLSWAVPEVRVTRIAGEPKPGELGTGDVIAVLAGGSGLLAAIRVLPEFLRAKKTGLSITMTVQGKPFTLTATNVDEVMPILDRLLDD